MYLVKETVPQQENWKVSSPLSVMQTHGETYSGTPYLLKKALLLNRTYFLVSKLKTAALICDPALHQFYRPNYSFQAHQLL